VSWPAAGGYRFAPGVWGALAVDYRHVLEAGNRSPNTVRIYLGVLYRFGVWVTSLDAAVEPATVTKGQIREYIGMVLAESSPGNAHNHFRSLSTFFTWLVAEEEIARSPMATVHVPHYELPVAPIIRVGEIAALLKACRGTGFAERRDTAIIRCLWATGGRRAEIAGLGLDDVDLTTDTAYLRGKGRRPRTVPFGVKTGLAVSRYLRSRRRHPHAELGALWLGGTGRGALSVDGVRAMLARQAGLGYVHPHMFRHAFAHYWQLERGNESDLMRIMGWKSRAMLARYAASAANERAQASARALSLGDRV
jgi:integrase/recombinase XerC